MNLTVTKQDGTKVPFNADYINKSIERACMGFANKASYVTQIASETQLTLYDGISTKELDQATINAALQNVQDDISYDKIATRLLLKTVYRDVVGDFDKDSHSDLEEKHRERFIAYISESAASGLLDERMAKRYDLNKLASALKMDRDELFSYAGLSTFLHRYSIKDSDQNSKETPQFFFMRVCMGLCYNEKDPNQAAINFYEAMSQLKYIGGGSTNVSSGTPNPAMSNCYLLEVHDSIEHISKSVSDVIKISKATGGLGVSLTKLRATGSLLRKSNTKSSGPTSFAKIMDTAIHAIVRGGKKKGALCFYMENWHYDFPEYINWRHNGGDDYVRMRTANTAAYISDEFMKRVSSSEMWYLFDPKEVPDLNELYGSAFSKRYAEYIEMAEAGKITMFKKMPAEELYTHMLISLQTTSHPWLTWKDTINLRALNNNTGTIHMSNLCTEICLPQDLNNIAVCNLASINIVAHLVEQPVAATGFGSATGAGTQTMKREIDWKELEKTVRLGVRHLDNLVDINQTPIPEAIKSDTENRAVGLGVMGFSDLVEKMGFAYDDDRAYILADQVFEFISYMAIDESTELAKVRGSYKNYPGSLWSKGMVPYDTLLQTEKERGEALTVDKARYKTDLNWDVLREKVKKGMRNATLMAVAPNANIGLLAGVVPGIDPRFAQVFSRNKFSGKYLDINHNLVQELQTLGIWDKVKGKIIEYHGDLDEIAEIPDHVKKVYKTSFNTSPYAFIEVAARAQKWVDQALSRNMYLETRDIHKIMHIYTTAWKKGLKSTYYLHMKPQHTAEQSTVSVNKAQQLGKRGFAAMRTAAGGFASVQTSAHIDPKTSTVTVDIEAKVSGNPADIGSSNMNLDFGGADTGNHPVNPGDFNNPSKNQAHIDVAGDNAPTDITASKGVSSAPASTQGNAGTTNASLGFQAAPQAATVRRNIVNVEDYGVNPQDALICDSCQ